MARIPRQAIKSLFETPTATEEALQAGAKSPADPLLGQQQVDELTAAVAPDAPMPEGGRTPDRNINLDRIDQPDEVAKLMDAVSRQTKNAGYEPKTFDELRGELDIDDEEIYSRLVGKKSQSRDYGLTGAQLRQARDISATSAMRLNDTIADVAERVRSGAVDDIELLDVQRQMLLHSALQSAVQKETRDVARSLAMHRDIASPFNTVQMEAMMNTHGGRDVILEKIRTIDAAVDPDAPLLTQLSQMNDAVKGSATAKFVNQLVGYRTVQLLWSPKTHIRNITGNLITAVTAPVEQFVAAAVSKIPGLGSSQKEFGEAYQMLLGTFGSLGDALRMAGKTAMTGESKFGATKFDDARSMAEPANSEKYTDSVLGKAWSRFYNSTMYAGKALMAEDEFFKTMAFNGQMRTASYKQARSEGLTGKKLSERIDDLISGPNQTKILDKVREDYAVRNDNGDFTPEFEATLKQEERVFYDMYKESTQFAHYQTFTDPLKTEFAQNLGKTLRNPLARLVVPFYRTPTNILAYASERSILAPFTKQWMDDVKIGGARRDMAIARIAMGTTTGLFIANMVWNGVVTGIGPKNPELRKTYEQDGWRRTRMKTSDGWISYAGFDPFSTQMAVIANSADAYRYATSDKQREHLAVVVALATAEALKERSFLQGISDLVKAYEQAGTGTVSQYAAKTAASFIPFSGLLRTSRQTLTDDVIRSTKSVDFADAVAAEIQAIIPFWSESLPPTVDSFGQVRRYDEPYGPDLFSPFVYSRTGDYGPSTELARNAVPMAQIQPVVHFEGYKIDTMIMTDDRGQGWKYFELQKSIGEARQSTVESLITQKQYKAMPDGPPSDSGMPTKGDALKQALQKARERGTKEFLKKNEMQVLQIIDSGLVEQEFWPIEPKVTTEKMEARPEPAGVNF